MSKRSGYIFTNKKHSQRAIMSTILGIISTAALVAVVYLTYVKKGNAPQSYGMTGFLVMLFSVTGLLLGLWTVREKERYKLFPCLGIALNAIALTGIGLVVYAGVYLA